MSVLQRDLFPTQSNIDYEDSDTAMVLYFKNMDYRVDTENLVCDYSCLLGEIGGNLGFFLGGSILLYVDLLSEQISKFLK